mgnify:FL=1
MKFKEAEKYAADLKALGADCICGEKLSSHTTFRIGGDASLFVAPADEDQLIGVISYLEKNGIRYFLLGKGSNVLFDDAGYDGAVVSTSKLDKISVCGNEITAQCGASFTYLASVAAENSLSGLEFAYGIPGSVGGAVFMNAGAYGSETAAVLKSSRYLDISDCTVKTLPLEEHLFGYRDSVFRHRRFIHLSSVFALQAGDKAQIRAYMNELMQRRRDKQPLEYPSAGSVFKRYPGRYTAQMIDEAGLRGLSVGGAQVSEKHAGFIVNKGNATSSDVIALVGKVREAIRDKYGIEIECEIIHAK